MITACISVVLAYTDVRMDHSKVILILKCWRGAEHHKTRAVSAFRLITISLICAFLFSEISFQDLLV